jgi:hypothetical protein
VGVPLGGVLVYALYSLTQVENMLLQGATPSKKKDNTAAKAGDEYADAVV